MIAKRVFYVAIVAAICVMLIWLPDRPEKRPSSVTLVGFPSEFIVNPTTYSSESKEFQLSVNPTDRYGRGGADYVMTKNGEKVWASNLPYTLLSVKVTKFGEVVGYSYSHGIEGFGSTNSEGDFRVVILAPNGTPRLNEATDRQPSNFLHTSPNPISKGLIVDEMNDRVIVRVADSDINRRSETWWTYAISTGEPLGRLNPLDKMDDSEHLSYLIDARIIPQTPLILLHWWRYQYPDPVGQSSSIIGGYFAVLDENATPVWELDLPRDYVVEGDEDAQDRLMDFVQRHGAILNTQEPETFDLYFAAKLQRTKFRVTGTTGKWSIDEISRRPAKLEELLGEATAIADDFQLTSIRSISQIELESSHVESPIRNLMEFTFDDHGQIGFIRQNDDESHSFVLVDDTGSVVCDIALNISADENSRWTSCSWISDQRFLLTRAEYGTEKRSQAWWIDAEERTLSPFADFESPPIKRLQRFSDGGFVALATMRYKYTMTDGLYGFDKTGRLIWKIDTDSHDSSGKLFSPEDIAVTPDDQVAVLDNIRNTIQLFSRKGEYIREISLKAKWQRKPNYLTGIRAVKDGFVIRDFNGSPPYVVTDPDGISKRSFNLTLESGRRLDESFFTIAPDGSMWASDGDAIIRLTSDGVADRVLGISPESEQLSKIAGSTVDETGRIYLVESRNANVHIFDSSGSRVRVCVPKPEDFGTELYDTSISVSDSGEILLCVDDIGGSGQFIKFSSSGERIGYIKLDLDTDFAQYQPATKLRMALTYDSAVFLDSKGKVIREISRRPSGDWLTRPSKACFARNGWVSILDSHTINIYMADGTPIRTIGLPSILGRFPKLAFTSNRVVVSGKGYVVVYDLAGSLIKAAKLSSTDEHFQPHIVANGQELLIVPSMGTKLHRLELP